MTACAQQQGSRGQELGVLGQVGVVAAGSRHDALQLGQREDAVRIGVGLLEQLLRMLQRSRLVHRGRIAQRPDGALCAQHSQAVVRHYRPAQAVQSPLRRRSRKFCQLSQEPGAQHCLYNKEVPTLRTGRLQRLLCPAGKQAGMGLLISSHSVSPWCMVPGNRVARDFSIHMGFRITGTHAEVHEGRASRPGASAACQRHA